MVEGRVTESIQKLVAAERADHINLIKLLVSNLPIEQLLPDASIVWDVAELKEKLVVPENLIKMEEEDPMKANGTVLRCIPCLPDQISCHMITLTVAKKVTKANGSSLNLQH